MEERPSQVRYRTRWLSEPHFCTAYGMWRMDGGDIPQTMGPGKFIEIELEQERRPLFSAEVDAVVSRETVPSAGLYLFCAHGFSEPAQKRAKELDVTLLRPLKRQAQEPQTSAAADMPHQPLRPGHPSRPGDAMLEVFA